MDEAVESRQAELIGQVAGALRRRGLTTPAILFLEANKPFSFVLSQLLLVAEPLLGFFVAPQRSRELAALLEDQTNIETLIQQLEQ